MEGQDVARLATARGITDSYAEQGLEAELSVDPGTRASSETVTYEPRDSTLPDTPIGGSGIPGAARESDGSER